MTKIPPKRKPILRIILLSLVAIPVLLVLFIVGSILLSPLFDAIDKTKFDQMDTQTRQIYTLLQNASGGTQQWKYEAKCTAVLSGDWPTGEYYCKTEASTTVDAVDAGQLVSLHEKYYPVINGSSLLRPTSALDKQKPSQFGMSFVVSSAERQYQFVRGEQDCDYLAKLAQPYNPSKSYDRTYGAPIEDGGRIILSMTCTATAQNDWYK